jgi:hypothetical protein
MGVYQEFAGDTFQYHLHWKELVADTGAQLLHLTNEGQEATLQGWIPWNMQRSAARHFLGFAYEDTVAPWLLHRENPARHPICPWMRAHSFSTSSAVVQANFDNINNIPRFESLFDPALFSTYYKWVLATVKFRNFRCKFFTDAQVGADEWKRSTHFDFAPKIEALSADGLSQLKFAETSAAAGGIPAGPAAGVTPFPAPLAEVLAKADFFVTWSNVPWYFVSDSDFYFHPTKMLAQLGKINTALFLDKFAAGTALFTSIEGTEFDFPVPSDDLDVPLKGFHIRLGFNFYNPRQGAAAPVTSGHNTFVWRANGRSYFASRSGVANLDLGLYQRGDFATLFEHVGKP